MSTSFSAQAAGGFRPDIEGLRAVAVLLVVLYHAGLPFCGGGFIGVDVFFVLSGYLISGLLIREIETKGHLDLWHFYARRARRLLPASALMLVVTAAAIALLLSPPEQANLARSARATAGYFSNMWFATQASNYFAPGIETNPFLHTWSLAVEEQFYAFWPLLVLFGLQGRRRLAVVMGAMGAASLILSIYATATHPVWAFYAMPLRAWEFAMGGLAWMIPPRYLGRQWSGRGWLGLLMILGAAQVYSRATSFPGVAAVVPALGTVMVLVSHVAAPSDGPTVLLKTPVLQWLGQRSYSWYLWHWPFLAVAASLAPGLGIPERAGLALASLAVAALTYRLVEHPIRASRRLMPRTRLSLGMVAALTAASIVVISLWQVRATVEANEPLYAKFTAASKDESDLRAKACFTNPGSAQVTECIFGVRDSSTTVVLMGDSHADNWFPALERLARERGWRIVTVLKASCPAAEVTNYNRILARIETECDAWRADALHKIVAMRPALVVLASSSNYRKDAAQVAPVSYDEWKLGTEKTIGILHAVGLHTAVVLDTPHADVDLPTCMSRATMRGSSGGAGCMARLTDDIRAAERDAVREFADSSVVDLADRFCDAGICAPIRDGMMVYRDSNHITASFAARLAPVLGQRLTF